jgi:hypothetical protein
MTPPYRIAPSEGHLKIEECITNDSTSSAALLWEVDLGAFGSLSAARMNDWRHTNPPAAHLHEGSRTLVDLASIYGVGVTQSERLNAESQ